MKRFFQAFLKEKRAITRMGFFLVSDLILISLAIFLAFFLRFEGSIPTKHFSNIWGMISLALIFSLPIFYFSKIYSFSWTYFGSREIISLIRAITISFLMLTTSLFILRDNPIFLAFPRSTLVISYFLIILFSAAHRFSKGFWLQIFRKRIKKEKERIIIAGAGDAGVQLLRSILSSSETCYKPVGFVDDDVSKKNVLIYGLRVLGQIKDLPRIAAEQGVERLFIALPSAGAKAIRRAVAIGRQAGFKKIKIIPSTAEIMERGASLTALKEVGVEDLLEREAVLPREEIIENFIAGKRILITGAAGSIGSELCRQLIKFNPQFIFLLDQDETGIFNVTEELKKETGSLRAFMADIQDRERVEHIFKTTSPHIVFHAAAYKHVPLMEEHPEEAVKNNIFGTKVVAEAAQKYGAEKFIFISTDKAVNPTSIMGATKRMGEMLCQSLNNGTRFISVRFGNVLDSRGSCIPIFREQIKRGGPVEVTHPEMKRYFMTNSEACLLVMEAGAMGQGGEVFVLDMGQPIKIVDLAKAMIRLSGLEPDRDIPIVFIGPRPGEKLFEEILMDEEGILPTKNPKIFQAHLSQINQNMLKSSLEELKAAVKEENKVIILEILKKLIPSFKH
jgi:FlaA1/EpsC-like NDP-sugar epimerase